MDFTSLLSIDNILAIAGLFTGGGIGMFFTWRYQKRKAKAEAEQAEAEAEQAEAEAEKARQEAATAESQAAKEMQDMYQQLIEDIKTDRDEQKAYIQELKEDRRHLREERNELRERQDKLEETVRGLQREVARNGRMVELMRPLLCGREGCIQRVPVTVSPSGEIEATIRPQNHKSEVEPYNED